MQAQAAIQNSLHELQTFSDVQAVLREVSKLLPNSFSTLTFRDQDNTASLDVDILKYTSIENLSDEMVGFYDEQFQWNDSLIVAERNFGASFGAMLGGGKFDSFLDNLPKDQILRSSFYNEFLLPLGVNDSIILDLFTAGTRKARLNIYFDSVRKSKQKDISNLNYLASKLRYALSFAYFNDDQFREMVRATAVRDYLSKQYEELAPSESKALYLWASQVGSLESVANEHGYQSKNTFRNLKQQAISIISDSGKGAPRLESRDQIIDFIRKVEKKIQIQRLLNIS